MDRSLTTWLKGLAVALMVMHHSLAFPKWHVDGFYQYLLPYTKSIQYFAGFAVVPMFTFLIGWTYYHHKNKSFRYSLNKIIGLLLSFWIILLGYVFLV